MDVTCRKIMTSVKYVSKNLSEYRLSLMMTKVLVYQACEVLYSWYFHSILDKGNTNYINFLKNYKTFSEHFVHPS